MLSSIIYPYFAGLFSSNRSTACGIPSCRSTIPMANSEQLPRRFLPTWTTKNYERIGVYGRSWIKSQRDSHFFACSFIMGSLGSQNMNLHVSRHGTFQDFRSLMTSAQTSTTHGIPSCKSTIPMANSEQLPRRLLPPWTTKIYEKTGLAGRSWIKPQRDSHFFACSSFMGSLGSHNMNLYVSPHGTFQDFRSLMPTSQPYKVAYICQKNDGANIGFDRLLCRASLENKGSSLKSEKIEDEIATDGDADDKAVCDDGKNENSCDDNKDDRSDNEGEGCFQRDEDEDCHEEDENNGEDSDSDDDFDFMLQMMIWQTAAIMIMDMLF